MTHLAGDPSVSAIPEKARGIPITHGGAEDVLRYDPDLVLAGPFGVSATVDLLRRLGRNVVVVPLPQDLDGVRASVRAVAAAVGEEAKGEAHDRRLRPAPGRLRAGRSERRRRPPSSIRSAARSRAPAAWPMRRWPPPASATWRPTYRLTPRRPGAAGSCWWPMPPDLLVLSSNADEYRTALADNLRHPVIGLLRQRGASLELPWRHWLCGTPHIADAIERLAEARGRASRRARDDAVPPARPTSSRRICSAALAAPRAAAFLLSLADRPGRLRHRRHAARPAR